MEEVMTVLTSDFQLGPLIVSTVRTRILFSKLNLILCPTVNFFCDCKVCALQICRFCPTCATSCLMNADVKSHQFLGFIWRWVRVCSWMY